MLARVAALRMPPLAARATVRAAAPPRSHRAYNTVCESDLAFFRGVLGADGAVVTDAADLQQFNEDWLGKYRGRAPVALLPSTTEHVRRILQHCSARNIAVVPQGGNTGLVGGSVPVQSELVLSLRRMNRIRHFDAVSGVVQCDAGVVLEELGAYLADRGHTVPLDLGAKGSCHIGGNVSTNAGGIRYLRYGSLHGSVLGLEVVLADGAVLDTMTTLRKDNTGYDLKQLFIGGEGTLGVVTAVSLLAAPKPASVNVCFLGVQDYPAVLRVFQAAKHHLGEILSAYEFMDHTSLSYPLQQLQGARHPLSQRFPFYVLVETSGSNGEHDQAKLEVFLEEVMSSGAVEDGALAQDESQKASLWALREEIGPSLGACGAVYKYDVSIPHADMYALVEDVRHHLRGAVAPERIAGYGHVGDANLHLNILTEAFTEEMTERIEPFVYEWIAGRGGSVSAEHGIGYMKPHKLHYSKSPCAIALMRQLKEALDPAGILNPYKVLPPA